MPLHEKLFLLYLIFISIVSVIVTVVDKNAAKRRSRRISERTLLFISLIFGALAMYITMIFIRHKTKHPKFMIGLPVIMILNFATIYFCAYLVKVYA